MMMMMITEIFANLLITHKHTHKHINKTRFLSNFSPYVTANTPYLHDKESAVNNIWAENLWLLQIKREQHVQSVFLRLTVSILTSDQQMINYCRKIKVFYQLVLCLNRVNY